MNELIMERLKEGRDKLGDTGEPVWSQAMFELDLLLTDYTRLQELVEEVVKGYEAETFKDFDWVDWYLRAIGLG